jgi:hypothetical protein
MAISLSFTRQSRISAKHETLQWMLLHFTVNRSSGRIGAKRDFFYGAIILNSLQPRPDNFINR